MIPWRGQPRTCKYVLARLDLRNSRFHNEFTAHHGG